MAAEIAPVHEANAAAAALVVEWRFLGDFVAACVEKVLEYDPAELEREVARMTTRSARRPTQHPRLLRACNLLRAQTCSSLACRACRAD